MQLGLWDEPEPEPEPTSGKWIPVRLTPAEFTEAERIGNLRQDGALRRGLRVKYGQSPEAAREDHVLGACGEMAVHLVTGIPWQADLFATKGGDVGHLQVRTARKRWYRLILHPDDDPDGVFVLVVGQEPDPGVIVVGWIVGRDGMRREYLEGPNGRPLAWFVPQPALKPFPIEDA